MCCSGRKPALRGTNPLILEDLYSGSLKQGMQVLQASSRASPHHPYLWKLRQRESVLCGLAGSLALPSPRSLLFSFQIVFFLLFLLFWFLVF